MNGHIIYKLSGMSHQNTFSVNSMKHFSYLLPFSSGCLSPFVLWIWSLQFRPGKGFLNTVVCGKKIASYQKKFAIKLSFVLGHILKSHDNIILSRGTHRMAALSYPLYLGGNGAVPRLELFHWFLRIWAALSVNQSVKKWGILLICFFKYCTTRNAHLLILFIWRVPVSDQPLPLLPVLKLASLTILPEQLLSSPQSFHSGPGDSKTAR